MFRTGIVTRRYSVFLNNIQTVLLLLINKEVHRLSEIASDELGRLDATCASAPGAAEIALRLVASDTLAQTTRSGFLALVAAEVDPLHDALLGPAALAWRDLLQAEERRVRGGALLSVARFAPVVPVISEYAERERLDAIWREPGSRRAVLDRAIELAAWSPDVACGEAGAALLLCATGRTDRVRVLPFATAEASARVSAIAAYRAGDTTAWSSLALTTLAARARAARLLLRTIIDAQASEEARLASLGRAAITARGVLTLLRSRLGTTVPLLAEDLGLSRPAASDALERLVALGLAREVTGRARDRVFVYEAACTLATPLLDAPAS